MNTDQFNDVPISVFLAVCIIVIFLLYTTSVIKTIPCGKNMTSNFIGNFVHVDFYHLIANVFGLYALSRVEKNIGGKKFITLVALLLVMNTCMETAVHKIYSKIPCSIGFSGVLFGIAAWELVNQRQLDIVMIMSLAAFIVPSFYSSKVSIIGHIIGVVSGLLLGGLVK